MRLSQPRDPDSIWEVVNTPFLYDAVLYFTRTHHYAGIESSLYKKCHAINRWDLPSLACLLTEIGNLPRWMIDGIEMLTVATVDCVQK